MNAIVFAVRQILASIIPIDICEINFRIRCYNMVLTVT